MTMPDDGSGPVEPISEGIHDYVLAIDEVLRRRIVAAMYICNEAAHCLYPQRLKPVLLSREVDVDLGMPGNPSTVLA